MPSSQVSEPLSSALLGELEAAAGPYPVSLSSSHLFESDGVLAVSTSQKDTKEFGTMLVILKAGRLS